MRKRSHVVAVLALVLIPLLPQSLLGGDEPTAAWLLGEFNFDLDGTVILE